MSFNQSWTDGGFGPPIAWSEHRSNAVRDAEWQRGESTGLRVHVARSLGCERERRVEAPIR